MAKKKSAGSGSISNKRARFDYELKESFMAGLVLNGPEVRSIRSSHVTLTGSFVTMKDNEAWLMNAQVTPLKTNAAHLPSEIQIRNRKLLLKKRELEALQEAKNQGYTIVPLRILNKGKFIKIEIAIGKGKRQYDKRHSIKKRDTDRDTARALR
ncbi:SsrA-binding protein SmpB [soil metagenome]